MSLLDIYLRDITAGNKGDRGDKGDKGDKGDTGPAYSAGYTGADFSDPGAVKTWTLSGSGVDLVGNLATVTASANTTLQLQRSEAYGTFAGAIAELRLTLANNAVVEVYSGSSSTIATITHDGLYRFVYNGTHWVLWEAPSVIRSDGFATLALSGTAKTWSVWGPADAVGHVLVSTVTASTVLTLSKSGVASGQIAELKMTITPGALLEIRNGESFLTELETSGRARFIFTGTDWMVWEYHEVGS